ncbi:MAG: hypothetical protein WBN75_03960 [Verrucomicrobiia bacterium]
MTKQKKTTTGLPKTSGDKGKSSAAFFVVCANLRTDFKARVTYQIETGIGDTHTKQHGF